MRQVRRLLVSRCPQGTIICFVLLSLVAYPPPRTGFPFLFRTSGRQQFNPIGKYKADGVLETVRLSGNSTQPLAWFGDGPFPLQSQIYSPCPGVGAEQRWGGGVWDLQNQQLGTKPSLPPRSLLTFLGSCSYI